MTTALRNELLREAEHLLNCTLELEANTTMPLLASDHGYASWMIGPLNVKGGDEMAILIVEDAMSPRRFTLLVMDDEPYVLCKETEEGI